MKFEDIKKVAVCGSGSMGAGIIQVAAQSGFDVVVLEVNDAAIARGKSIIEGGLKRLVDKGKMTQEVKDGIISKISYTTEASDLKDVDFVFEAVFESIEVKKELFGRLDKAVKDDVVYASNTSSLSITEMAASCKRPGKFIGMHFFNPVPVMKLVEIIPAIQTDEETISLARAMAEKLGKTSVLCKDTPGFIVNRLLVPMMLDAARLYEAGVASAEDIDNAMVLGTNMPMGPLKLMDFTGVEIAYYVGNIFYEYTKDPRFNPPDIMRKMVKAGWLGMKAGKGFYDYSKKD
ncbi:MAG: 3-hydroxybutyryl-CoA dehydrogenase [bacterium]